MTSPRLPSLCALFLGACVLQSGCASRQPDSAQPSLGISRDPAVAPTTIAADRDLALTPVQISREAWVFGEEPGHIINTPNYRLYTTIRHPAVLDSLPAFYERALEHYTNAITPLPLPSVKLESYLFQNRGQWQLKTQEILPDQARMFSNLGRGGFTTRGVSVLYYIDFRSRPRDTFAIAAHEGWHQYTQQTFKHQLPIWLEEGLATYMEGHILNADGTVTFNPHANRERSEALREAIASDRLIPLHDLLTRSPQSFLNQSKNSLLTYYAQVWALTRYLMEGEDGGYRNDLADALIDAAEGRLVGRVASSSTAGSVRRRGIVSATNAGPAVLQAYFDTDLAEFERRYLAFAKHLASESTNRSMPRR